MVMRKVRVEAGNGCYHADDKPASKNGLVGSMLNALETLNWIMRALSDANCYLNDFDEQQPCDSGKALRLLPGRV